KSMRLRLMASILLPGHWILRCAFGMANQGIQSHSAADIRTEKAVLMGHTSLVGQIQMRGNTLVTGGSDGSVRVWDLEKLRCVTRMAAHDNSVTSLQFDDKIIVTGGSDGYVKVPPPTS